jgi:hypothetical protein
MLTRITELIYPNKCEVVELPNNQYFYPIYKNGSSSVIEYAQQQNCKFLFNQQLNKLNDINIVLRDPLDRYISGIVTFVHITKNENPELDINTILWFAENYLFLNRHYSPQLTWLINLNRYTKAKFKLFGMNQLSNFTPLKVQSFKDNLLITEDLIEKLRNNIHNEMYLRLDNLLLDLVGQELTFNEILNYLKEKDSKAFEKLKCIVLD